MQFMLTEKLHEIFVVLKMHAMHLCQNVESHRGNVKLPFACKLKTSSLVDLLTLNLCFCGQRSERQSLGAVRKSHSHKPHTSTKL